MRYNFFLVASSFCNIGRCCNSCLLRGGTRSSGVWCLIPALADKPLTLKHMYFNKTHCQCSMDCAWFISLWCQRPETRKEKRHGSMMSSGVGEKGLDERGQKWSEHHDKCSHVPSWVCSLDISQIDYGLHTESTDHSCRTHIKALKRPHTNQHQYTGSNYGPEAEYIEVFRIQSHNNNRKKKHKKTGYATSEGTKDKSTGVTICKAILLVKAWPVRTQKTEKKAPGTNR